MSSLERLRQAGLRLTAARLTVLQCIETAADGIAADDVFRQLPAHGGRASISTVYRVLHEFEQADLVQHTWDRKGTAIYRLCPARRSAGLRVVSSDGLHGIDIVDADLHARLLEALRRAGIEPSGQILTLRVEPAAGHLPPAD